MDLGFCISLKAIFSNVLTLTVINKYGKGAVNRLQECFDPFTMLSVEGSSETRLLKDLYNHVFGSRYFRKYIGYKGYISLAIV